MAEFCYVVERIEWDEDLDGKHEYWEQRDICRVCKDYEDAKSFVEKNSEMTDYPMRWLGDRRYSGRTVTDGKTEEGLTYELHYVPIF